jgi:hypothetical protein
VPHADEAVQVAVPVVPQASEHGWVAPVVHCPAHIPAEQV